MGTLDVDLAGQFLVGRSESLAPPGWTVRRSAGWCLASHPTLPVIEICGREGALLGWLLGYAITPDGVLLSPGAALPFTLSLRDGAAVFERALLRARRPVRRDLGAAGEGYRWRDRLPDDLLKQGWPELLEIRFDKAFCMRGAPPLHKRALRKVLGYIVPRGAGR